MQFYALGPHLKKLSSTLVGGHFLRYLVQLFEQDARVYIRTVSAQHSSGPCWQRWGASDPGSAEEACDLSVHNGSSGHTVVDFGTWAVQASAVCMGALLCRIVCHNGVFSHAASCCRPCKLVGWTRLKYLCIDKSSVGVTGWLTLHQVCAGAFQWLSCTDTHIAKQPGLRWELNCCGRFASFIPQRQCCTATSTVFMQQRILSSDPGACCNTVNSCSCSTRCWMAAQEVCRLGSCAQWRCKLDT